MVTNDTKQACGCFRIISTAVYKPRTLSQPQSCFLNQIDPKCHVSAWKSIAQSHSWPMTRLLCRRDGTLLIPKRSGAKNSLASLFGASPLARRPSEWYQPGPLTTGMTQQRARWPALEQISLNSDGLRGAADAATSVRKEHRKRLVKLTRVAVEVGEAEDVSRAALGIGEEAARRARRDATAAAAAAASSTTASASVARISAASTSVARISTASASVAGISTASASVAWISTASASVARIFTASVSATAAASGHGQHTGKEGSKEKELHDEVKG